MSSGSVLEGIVVVERASRLATAACGHLLASLGAHVVTLESPETRLRRDGMSAAMRRLYRAGKEIAIKSNIYNDQPASADVVLFDPDGTTAAAAFQSAALKDTADRIVCAFTPGGLEDRSLPFDMSDAAIQALSGVMAVTGAEGGAPELVRVPICEQTAALVGASAVLAALESRRRDGAGQLIDISLVEVMLDQLRTHVALGIGGQSHGFRIGCRHPLCSPWNAYRASDGWVLVCSASDVQWDKILDVIGRFDLKGDARFATAAARKKVISIVDDAMQAWTGGRSMADVAAAFTAVGIPAGPALDPRQVPDDVLLRQVGTLVDSSDGLVPAAPFRFSRTPARLLVRAERPAYAPASSGRPGKEHTDASPAPAPLAGLKVVEISRYAAGPLAGLVLASLGAEVIKIESPGGEDCRAWTPQFGDVSGYFVNFNYGKASSVLDLSRPEDKACMQRLIADADVLLHNLRAGVMEKLGFGYAGLASANPALIYCAVSGFGEKGPRDAALDTVIQGRLGLTSLIGDGVQPLRVGFSIADQVAGHFAAAGILAALHERTRSGKGQVVDVAMCDAVAWLTQTGWACGAAEERGEPDAVRMTCADGWVVADDVPDDTTVGLCSGLSRQAAVRHLRDAGIPAAPVLELDEVLRLPLLAQRRIVSDVTTAGGTAPAVRVPLALTRFRPAVPDRMHRLDGDPPRFATAQV